MLDFAWTPHRWFLVAYRIIPIPEANALVEVYDGPQRLDDLLRLKEEELARGLIRRNVMTIADLRTASLDITRVEAKAYAAWHQEHNPEQIGSRTALLVTDSKLEQQLYQLYTEAIEPIRTMQVFDNLTSALGWLGLDPTIVASVWAESSKELGN